jgi:hypothetical protein
MSNPFSVWWTTDVERVRYYLGIPLTPEKTAMLIAAMTNVEQQSHDAVRRARELLDQLEAAEREINSARPFAGQRFANGVTWFQNKRLESIKAEARRIAKNLAYILGLTVERDVWEEPVISRPRSHGLVSRS